MQKNIQQAEKRRDAMMRSTRPRLMNLFQGKGEAPDLDGVIRPRGKLYSLGLAMVAGVLLSSLWPSSNRNSADTNTLPLTNPNAPKIPNNHMIVKAGRVPTQEVWLQSPCTHMACIRLTGRRGSPRGPQARREGIHDAACPGPTEGGGYWRSLRADGAHRTSSHGEASEGGVG